MRSFGLVGRGTIGALLAACALFAIPASASAAPVSVGHSGWSWGDPQPQGHTLTGLDFAGGRGYAAGAFGTLLRTDDSGANWLGIPTGITDPLRRVRAVDVNTVVIGGRCALRRSDNGGQSFTRLPWTASDQSCPSEIVSFHFPSPQTGYLLTADGSVLRTPDGGQTFSRRTSVPGSNSAGGGRVPTDIFFTSADTGVAITGNPGDGRIFRTTDGANSWVEVDQRGAALKGLFFVDALTGYAVGDGSLLLRTVDGGENWAPRPLSGAPGPLNLTSLDCADLNTCLIAETSGSRLLRTTDGGATAEAITPSTQAVFAVAFASSTRAVAVGDRGATVVSDNGGMTWSPVGAKISGQQFRPVRASSPQLAQAGGEDGALARTVDGGVNWFIVGVPTTVAVNDASFPSDLVGFALDAAGGAFKTANGGVTWTILNTGTTAAPRAILALDQSNVLLAGPQGLRRSSDGGGSFAAVSDKDVRNAQIAGVDAAGDAVAAYGPKALAVSTDKGAAWTNVRRPDKKARIADADFASARAGYAMTTDGRVWRTTNAGKKWKDLPAIGTDDGTGISFSGLGTGYLSVQRSSIGSPSGFAYRTTDGGKTWSPQLIYSAATNVWDAGPTAFANATDGSFFATTVGGQSGTPSALTIAATKKGSSSLSTRKSVEIKIGGKLNPPEGGEQIEVSIREVGESRWRPQFVTAASNGEFTASFKVARPSWVVAQWRGDDDRAGTGSRALLVEPPGMKN